MVAAPGTLLSAVADNRINQFVFKAVLHVLVYAYMGLAAIIVERPGTEETILAACEIGTLKM